MNPPTPIHVIDLFHEERAGLLDLLSGLTPDEWDLPTVCPGWSLKDVALHILGGDLGNLARRRDGFLAGSRKLKEGESIVDLVNRINDQWVQTARWFSTRLIIDLLAVTGPQLFSYFATLDLSATSGGVSWAGLDRAPMWLDVAREYTERWLHQQHIRDAIGKPGLSNRRFLHPILATFVYALPRAFRDTPAPPGTAVHLQITGEAGGDWTLMRESPNWTLYTGAPSIPNANVTLDQFTAWRLFTKGLTPAQAQVAIQGDPTLGSQVLQAVAIIA
ncbi:MAG: maleylpyruvate isomerase family mycothiol-dependent enzyme [Chloroflexia bacterium]